MKPRAQVTVSWSLWNVGAVTTQHCDSLQSLTPSQSIVHKKCFGFCTTLGCTVPVVFLHSQECDMNQVGFFLGRVFLCYQAPGLITASFEPGTNSDVLVWQIT